METPTTTVLIAEDEPKIAEVLIDYLKAYGYQHIWMQNGLEVVPAVREQQPDLILLDVMLPGKDGMTICREVRAFSDLPIIMVTARIEEIDRLLGLELGADDYICKPFSPREVMARVKSVLGRFQRTPSQDQEASPIVIDEVGHSVKVEGKELDLTPNEYNLIKTFYENQGRVFSRDQLLNRIYDDFRDVSDRSIDSHVKNLRKKLSVALPGRELIRSVYGVGYKFEI